MRVGLLLLLAAAPAWCFEKLKAFPHDASAFTQGLVVDNGQFIEGTGLNGKSTLRRVDIETGRVLQKIDLPPEDFGEGVTVLNGKIYQLTWKGQRGYVYDAKTFKKEHEFKYTGEGWGLTHDGKSLILSDGSDSLRFIDPKTFKVTRTIRVKDGKTAVIRINELEWIPSKKGGEIYANVWFTNRIARIDPKSGKVLGWIDLTSLGDASERSSDPDGVLNGIAYDSSRDRLFVTGKFWRKVFEIKVK